MMRQRSSEAIKSTDVADNLIISVKLESGKFGCLLKIPMHKTPEEKEHLFEGWLKMLEIFLSRPAETKIEKEA